MENDSKLDYLIKKIEEAEVRQQEFQADLISLKTTVEGWFPDADGRIEGLQTAVGKLQIKVEKLEEVKEKEEDRGIPLLGSQCSFMTGIGGSDAVHKFKEEMNRSEVTLTPNLLGSTSRRPNFVAGGLGHESPVLAAPGWWGYMGYGSLPSMNCPQFNGDSPQMWRANCETYFETYGIHPGHWVRLASMNFTGNAVFWLQSVRSQLVGISWEVLCEKVCAHFTRDKKESLIRQWYVVRQEGTVAAYVEKFDSLMHQLLAYDNALTPLYFVTRFVEGLKEEIRSAVMMQRPRDLDAACALSFLQEEVLEGSHKKDTPRTYISRYNKTVSKATTATAHSNQDSPHSRN
ncbi:hypothetical protein GUJ93_ZPchr0005g14322 [Zizania palustris]|uniref:Retrotransposon gag domain-containing protein n=1 Tax=Zizania palustris TaxID=103762 RepID=A0A8J5TA15_ZIZPA|nr:hypothetical protein GUJ93_ZPchr0005g14322 [Zizania palustris]